MCDTEAEEEVNGEWWNKWFKPFDPEEGAAEEGSEQGEREEDDAGEGIEGEPEEAQKAETTKVPSKPSKEEVDEHMITHLPFRSWCPHCVRGKSKGKPHKKSAQGNREIPTVALDYTFMYDTQNEQEE